MDVADPDRGGGCQRLRVPGRRGRSRGRVREEHAVRARRRKSAPRTRPNPVSHLGNDAPDFESSTVRRLLRRPADRAGRRQARARRRADALPVNGGAAQPAPTTASGTAASATARTATSTTTASAARSPAPSPVTRCEVWFSRAAASSRAAFTYTVRERHGAPGADPRRRGLHRRACSPGVRRPHGPNYLDVLHGRARRRTASTTTSTTSTRATARRRTRSACSATTRRSSGTRATTCIIREPGQPGGHRARRARAGRDRRASATTSTRAASCSTRARTPRDGQLNGVHLQPGRPAAVLRRCGPRPLPRTVIPTSAAPLLNDDFLQYYLGAYVLCRRGGDRGRRRQAVPADGLAGSCSSGAHAATLNGGRHAPTTRITLVTSWSPPRASCRRRSSRSSQLRRWRLGSASAPPFDPLDGHALHGRGQRDDAATSACTHDDRPHRQDRRAR